MPPPKLEKSINWESKYIATNLELSDRIEQWQEHLPTSL